MPPDRQGKAISEGPLPFVFGTDAEKLKQRFFMRLTTPRNARGEVWLEAYPKFQQDRADFSKMDLILKTDGLLPDAIQKTEPNGKDRTVYTFQNVVVNRQFGWLINPNWWRAPVPFGWKAELDPLLAVPQAGCLPPRR